MNLPNQLSVARLVLTAPFVAMFYSGTSNAQSIALLIFGVASFTDLLDGYLARKHNLVTNFGKLFDPLADKILMAAALTMLAIEKVIPAWIVIAILAREFFVTGIRQIAISQGVVLAAEKLGKHKMVWQVITVCYFMMKEASREPIFAFTHRWFEWRLLSPEYFGRLTIAVTAFLTIASGLSYFWKNRRLFSDA